VSDRWINIERTDLEADKYHDPKNPWIVISREGHLYGRFPSNCAARREQRRLVIQKVERLKSSNP